LEGACKVLGREPPPDAPERLEAVLERLCARGHAAHPSFAVDDEVFVTHLARCGARLDGPVEDVRAEDLFLACACLVGIPEAVEHLWQTYRLKIAGYIHRFGNDAFYLDEVERQLWDTLLFGPDGTPRLATYAGTGALERWIGISAQRIAMMMMRHEDVTARAHEELAAEARLVSLDPELEAIKFQYREPFQRALQAAIAGLDARDKTVYRMHLVDGLTLDRIGKAYGVHHTTVLRWLEAARERVLAGAKQRLRAELEIEPPRGSRRLHWLRGWSHGTKEQTPGRGAGARGAAGLRAVGGARVAVGGDHRDRPEVGLHARNFATVGATRGA
jgi:RNA polymerase sigma-70 factor (ECF subfamily)